MSLNNSEAQSLGQLGRKTSGERVFPGDRTSAVTERRRLLRVTVVWAAAAAAAGWVEQRGEGSQTRLVRAPGVVCRASAGLRCLARRPDAGTRSQTLPGSTKTGTGGT